MPFSLTDKVRLLYDRGLPTARLVVRSKEDLDKPLVCVCHAIEMGNGSPQPPGYDALLLASYESHPPAVYVANSLHEKLG